MLLWVREDGIVGLETILVKKSLVTASCQPKLLPCSTTTKMHRVVQETKLDLPNALDIQKRVLEAQ